MHLVTILATSIYAIVGGPSVGKTSIVKALKDEGEETLNEVATELILERLDDGHKEPWNEENFQLDILHKQLAREKAVHSGDNTDEKGRVFVDRGILDGLVYLDIRGKLQTEEFKEIKKLLENIDISNHYDKVFYVEPYNGDNFETEVTAARHEDKAEAIKISNLTKEVYSKYYILVHVPAYLTPKERAKFILDTI